MGSKCVWNAAAHISRLTSLGLLTRWFQQIILNLFCYHVVDPPHFELCSIWWCPPDLVLYIKKNDNVMPATASEPLWASVCVCVCVCVCVLCVCVLCVCVCVRACVRACARACTCSVSEQFWTCIQLVTRWICGTSVLSCESLSYIWLGAKNGSHTCFSYTEVCQNCSCCQPSSKSVITRTAILKTVFLKSVLSFIVCYCCCLVFLKMHRKYSDSRGCHGKFDCNSTEPKSHFPLHLSFSCNVNIEMGGNPWHVF